MVASAALASNGRSTAILAVGPAGILSADDTERPGETPGRPTGKMPVLRFSQPRRDEFFSAAGNDQFLRGGTERREGE